MEYFHGSVCHYCGEIITLRVSIQTVYDGMGAPYEAIDTDIDVSWWPHVIAHQEAGDAPCDESVQPTRMPRTRRRRSL